jgi:hypothetical protein
VRSDARELPVADVATQSERYTAVLPYLGYPPSVERCYEIASKGYQGFILS